MRLTVRRVLAALATYPDRAELIHEYPELEEEDIQQALEFAALHQSVINRSDRQVERLDLTLQSFARSIPIPFFHFLNNRVKLGHNF
jgi:hypothetical protein